MSPHIAAAGIPFRAGRGPLRARHRALVSLVGSGLLLMAVSALLEIGHHAGVRGLTAEALGAAGHLVALAGMVLTAVGVALAAALRRRERAHPRH